jgi:tagatose-1,6-bisphosphate aldolase non-catalytic subunit AgaZ/GatZ
MITTLLIHGSNHERPLTTEPGTPTAKTANASDAANIDNQGQRRIAVTGSDKPWPGCAAETLSHTTTGVAARNAHNISHWYRCPEAEGITARIAKYVAMTSVGM